jgi:predicted translin family RNA/ssDNA-binding protein
MSQEQAKPVKDIYAVYQQNVDKFLSSVKQSVPRYHQSVTNAQQEYVDACENVANSCITLQKEFARKAGITTNVPEAALKVIRDTTEEVVKATSIQNQIALAAIDAAQQNIKTFNDNAKSFADLNKNILQSWISAFTTRNN